MAPWLVTWEASNPALLPAKRIAAVLRGYMGAERVKDIVDSLHASHAYTEPEIVHFGKSPASNPNRADFARFDGIAWEGDIYCGHNPYLRARMVDDLRVKSASDGSPQITWRERERPTFPKPIG